MSFVPQIIAFVSNYAREDPGSVVFLIIIFSIGIGALTNIPVALHGFRYRVEHFILIGKGQHA